MLSNEELKLGAREYRRQTMQKARIKLLILKLNMLSEVANVLLTEGERSIPMLANKEPRTTPIVPYNVDWDKLFSPSNEEISQFAADMYKEWGVYTSDSRDY